MTMKVLDKVFEVRKENAKQVSRELTDMLFDAFDEEMEIIDAQLTIYEAFGV